MVCMGYERKVVQLQVENAKVQAPPFRVLQWNVLGDGLAQGGEFIKVLSKGEEHAEKVLGWEHRLPLIVNEIAHSRADIICLQEVTHYDQLQGLLQPLGYHGAYQEKASFDGLPRDGSALFYNTRRFRMEGPPRCKVYVNDDGTQHTQGCLQLLLLDEELQQKLLVATTHLKAKAGAANEAMRVSQVRQLLACLEETVAAATAEAGAAAVAAEAALSSTNSNGNGCTAASCPQHGVGVVICGDFNDVPGSKTIQEMQVGQKLRNIWQVPMPTAAAAATTAAAAPAAPETAAAAAAAEDPPAEAEFTTWKFRPGGEARRTIDYIWFSSGGPLHPVSRWQMPSRTEIGPEALPCETYPSDHLSVCCDFAWAPEAVQL